MVNNNENRNGNVTQQADIESVAEETFATIDSSNASLNENVQTSSGSNTATQGFSYQEDVPLDIASDSMHISGETELFEEDINDSERDELFRDSIDMVYRDEAENDVDKKLLSNEFDNMTNIIDGKKRKPVKRKKKKTHVRKIVVKTYATIILTTLSAVVLYFGVTFFQVPPTQGISGADLRVDMSDLPHYVGTEGEINLNLMFPTGSEFAKDGASIKDGILKIDSLDEFKLTYKDQPQNSTESKEISRQVKVVDGGVNVSDWKTLSSAIKEAQVVCMQIAYLAAPVMEGEKVKNASGFELKNDLYGNGCKLNVFEIVCCRNKNSGGKFTKPYLPGNGPVYGMTAFWITPRQDGKQTVMQDLHIIGNDLSTEEGGNLAGVSQTIIDKRGLNLFSAYGHLIAVEGDNKLNEDGEKGAKAEFALRHCVLENSHKLIHVRHSNMEFTGNIIRNASDTALSVATHANEKSVITSKNNVIANSLTGGVVFYCYDGDISTANAENSWNVLKIVKDSFLDIYNWKEQDGLAFMPETESGAEIANPVAKSEIPKTKYDDLKAAVDGKKYIHFAIIKLRTGGGLPINGSVVDGYQSLNYKTSRDKGYKDGFPLPGLAASIIKDIDVWGYYNKGDDAVKPIDILDVETVERLYLELKNGRFNTKSA